MTRAYITGVGTVTPLGMSSEAMMTRWTAGECGLVDGLGECDEFDPDDYLTRKMQRRADRYSHLAAAAGDEAIGDAGWGDELPYPADRIGCIVGTGIGGLGAIEQGKDVLREQGEARVSPFTIPNMMPNAAAAHLAIRYGLRGEVYGVVSACAAGGHAIGTGLRILDAGAMDAVLVGGAESALTPLARAAFATMGATSKIGISRPFDVRRDGFVLGEGAGMLVLETPEAATRRGARKLGEIIGYAATSDAYHLTAPDEKAEASSMAIERALDDAGLGPGDVDYVNAHGTSTPLNDRSETVAIKRAMGERAYDVPISSTKSVVGHLLGAAGAVEAVATVCTLRQRVAPPTVGCEEREDGLDLDYVLGESRRLPGEDERPELVALNNAFGFGGHNAVMVIRA